VYVFGEMHVCEWVQLNGEWRPFPWAFPAEMAATLGAAVIIRPITEMGVGESVPTAIKIAFQEMDLPIRECYLFADRRGRLRQLWNGKTQQAGTPNDGAEPVWRTIHTVVPPMDVLLDRDVERWQDTPFCVHDWSEIVHGLGDVRFV